MSIVIHNVPLIPQNTQNTCWWASARMVIQYHRQKLQQTTLEGGSIGQPELNKFIDKNNRVINPTKIGDLARLANFRMTSISPTAEGLVDLLRKHGPLWYAGVTQGFRGNHGIRHAVVITGCSTSGDEPTVNVNDPSVVGVGAKLTGTFDKFFGGLSAMAPMLHI